MGELNTKQLEYARCLCLGRDGRNCCKCAKPLCDLDSVGQLDHKDGNPKNNPLDGSNWQMMCASCNVEKWHRQKFELILDGDIDKADHLSISSKMEYRWVRWLYASITKAKGRRVTEEYAIETGALEIDGNPVTTKRYLAKHTRDPKHRKAVFRKVFIDFDEFIKLSKQVEDKLDFGNE